jgi:AbrB family looped-hinge helix DNA binding protein
MTTATLTSKGQITIPADVRRTLGVQTGDRVEFVEVQPGRFELVAATRSVRELKGMLGTPTRTLSIEDMNRVITEQGAKAGLRSGRSK